MAKRRRYREDARPADHSRQPAEPTAEPKLKVAGEAFAQFELWIDAELELLVGRWVHLAAPAASAVRRVIPKESHRPSEA